VLWALLRREWRFAAAVAATAIVGVLGSIMAYGFANHLDYLRVLSFLAERGETFYPNQSVNGLLNRVMVLIDPSAWNSLDFNDHGFPPFSPLVYGGTLIASIVLLSAALLRRGNSGDPDRAFDFCTMALSITMASPIAWEHHYGTIFPIFAVLLASVIGNRLRLILLIVSYVLVSNYIPTTNLLAGTVLNVAQSYLLAGALILLMLLHTARPGWQIVSVPAASPAPSTRAG
jgi:alpha-1,2-mannosyltransferase